MKKLLILITMLTVLSINAYSQITTCNGPLFLTITKNANGMDNTLCPLCGGFAVLTGDTINTSMSYSMTVDNIAVTNSYTLGGSTVFFEVPSSVYHGARLYSRRTVIVLLNQAGKQFCGSVTINGSNPWMISNAYGSAAGIWRHPSAGPIISTDSPIKVSATQETVISFNVNNVGYHFTQPPKEITVRIGGISFTGSVTYTFLPGFYNVAVYLGPGAVLPGSHTVQIYNGFSFSDPVQPLIFTN